MVAMFSALRILRKHKYIANDKYGLCPWGVGPSSPWSSAQDCQCCWMICTEDVFQHLDQLKASASEFGSHRKSQDARPLIQFLLRDYAAHVEENIKGAENSAQQAQVGRRFSLHDLMQLHKMRHTFPAIWRVFGGAALPILLNVYLIDLCGSAGVITKIQRYQDIHRHTLCLYILRYVNGERCYHAAHIWEKSQLDNLQPQHTLETSLFSLHQ